MEIVWNSRYDTGIRSIDLQHRELVEMINGLRKLPDEVPDGTELAALFQRLNQYIIFHFGHEESLMGSSAVSLEHRRQHAVEHASFARELRSRLDRATDATGREERDALVEYLKTWLLDHILKTDLELARHLDTRRPLYPGRPAFQSRGAGAFNPWP